MRNEKRCGAAVLMLFFAAQASFGHVTVSPRESVAGDEESYTMRVPTERDSATIRIEVEFPAEVSVTELDAKAGWEIEERRNADERIVGAVWSDGSIPPGEAEEFGFLARNPSESTTLVWKIIQVHADGSSAEWIGEPGSRGPAPVTLIQ